MNDSVTEEEAIRRVIQDGVVGDFCDVVDVVKRKFGLQVGAGQVEQVYGRMKEQRAAEAADAAAASPGRSARTDVSGRMPPRIDRAVLELRGSLPREASAEPAVSGEAAAAAGAAGSAEVGGQRGRVLEFVEAMGGFDAAREAISKVEDSLKQLMKKW